MRHLALLLITLAAIVCASAVAASPTQDAGIFVEPSISLLNGDVAVAPGSYAVYPFSLSQGSRVVARLSVTGGSGNGLDVALLDLENFHLFASGRPFRPYPDCSGRVSANAEFSCTVPLTNVYHLVLDNRRAVLMSRRVRAYVFAVAPEPTEQSKAAEKALGEAYQQLKRLFVFPDFGIAVRHCGTENAFSAPDITHCIELSESLEKQGLSNANSFVLLHEMGHSLLRLWDQPLWDNEDAADEFATVFFIMGNQPEPALEAARWSAARDSQREALAKVWVDDRHSLSIQRSRNIARWLNEGDELLRRWQRVLVPNMQTDALRALLTERGTVAWLDRSLVEQEVKRRSESSQ
ncbi:MAG: DUF4344 domain-containing metallopeptidase [Acidobacteriia bacterium]|nr:DUF4344 domain-containing metallopeptidase [Terriglobia bacterium]